LWLVAYPHQRVVLKEAGDVGVERLLDHGSQRRRSGHEVEILPAADVASTSFPGRDRSVASSCNRRWALVCPPGSARVQRPSAPRDHALVSSTMFTSRISRRRS